MSKFNATKSTNKTTTYEGGDAYAKDTETEWVNALCSSFLGNEFYRSSGEAKDDFVELTRKMVELRGIGFVARAAVFARNELGMRSISALAAAVANDYAFDGKRGFYSTYFRRPDDVAEVFAAIDQLGGKRSHALVRGAADYLSRLSPYSLGKYKMSRKGLNMYDLVNITHAHSDAIDAMKRGALEVPDTWEVAISCAKSVEERNAQWMRLVEEDRLGYLALIRNLRNIIEAAPSTEWLEDNVVWQLTDETRIRKSLVFPYQIYTAYRSISQGIPTCLFSALDEAFRTACGNMPAFDGDNALVLDVSGSMDDHFGGPRGTISIKQVCACYCAALYVANPSACFYKFGDYTRERSYDRKSNVFSIIARMCDNEDCGYSTNITSVYEALGRHYDRLFLFSDMQVMNGSFWGGSPIDALKAYRAAYGRTKVFSFDCGNYPSCVDNPNSPDFFQFTALNDNVFKFVRLVDAGVSVADAIAHYTY